MAGRISRPILAAILGLVLSTGAAAQSPRLHVPSPDWRDQVIYFVVTDRFADGDPRNNDQGAGEFAAGKRDAYNGGDLRGVVQRLDYIRGLGATALWITPPVANQWTVPYAEHTGYHGYWAENFMKVDRHLGKLEDYRDLSRSLHARGMYLVQDIVVNHTGDFFHYQGGWDPADPARFYARNAGSRPGDAPSQPPFDRNDARRAADRAAGIYHWTPNVADYNDPGQVLRFQMAGLDDLNTENAQTRRALRKSYGYWIREVGVDAFRVDTALYVPPEFFADFLHSRDPEAPGIEEVARRTGRSCFLTFGEGFAIDAPGEDRQARRIDRYMSAADGTALLPGMLNFPLYGSLADVFARGHATAELADRIERVMRVHARPHLMPTFVDNHDVDRFLVGGTEAGLKQALLALMTLPGIPTIYYGTEQGFREPRAVMFKQGYGSGGRDHYDTEAPLYRYVAAAVALRRANPVLSRGAPAILHANAAGPGAVAWRMSDGKDAAIVAFNTADEATLLDNLETGLAPGANLQAIFSVDGQGTDAIVGPAGRVTLRLAPRAGVVWKVATSAASAPPAAPAIAIDALPGETFPGDFAVSGSARAGATVVVVIDGGLANARRVSAGSDGRWQAVVDTAAMADPATRHRLVAWDAESGEASEAKSFRVDRPWKLLADVEDPEGDDRGPHGTYAYPTDASWAARQMDLRRVRVFGAGGALRIELTLRAISTSWNPPNGFDHVAFVIFVQMPGREGGAQVMPLQFAALPEGMRWHYRMRAHGWSNALFSAEGATATSEGTPITPAAAIRVDPTARTVSFVLPAAALGRPATLSGATIYATTWDYDGGFRALAREPVRYTIGGGDPAKDARIMDASSVITLP